MRIDCKFYESRTYPSGETVRACRLDMAPEAPWRCPENCPTFERKIMDAGWITGSLVHKSLQDEPPPLDEHAISMLGEAKEIINSIGEDVVAEVNKERVKQHQQQAKQKKRWWWPFGH